MSRMLRAYRRDHSEAVKILKTDLRIFQTLNNEIYQELTSLLALDDFRWIITTSACRSQT
jgi:hypothetical protein